MKRSVALVGVGGLLGVLLAVAPVVYGHGPKANTVAAVEQKAAVQAVDSAEAAPIEIPSAEPPLSSTFNPARSLAPLVEAVAPAVAAIEIEGKAEPAMDMQQIPPQLRGMFGMDPRAFQPQPMHGEGSGFVISADGLMLTNNHVVEHADKITAKFADGTTANAKVLGTDEHLDLALLRLEGDKVWQYVELGSSADARVGDWVVAVGNPLGLGATVTTGIISGKGRAIGHDVYDDFLQTDAAINPGNSGGPLFDLDGKVIGINTAIIEGANTVGFSIPSDLVKRVVDDLETKGYVARGFMGMESQDTPDGKGVTVAAVHKGFPAEKAGLNPGDVIQSIDGEAVTSPGALVRAIGNHSPGETVTLAVLREGKPVALAVELGERPSDDKMPGTSAVVPELGLELQALSESRAAELGVQYGVEITNVEKGKPGDGFVKPGDLILEINHWPVANADQVSELVKRSGKAALFTILRDGRKATLVVPLR